MVNNYVKVALRNIAAHKGYNVIRITGMTISLTAFILICLYLQWEYNYDRFHEHYSDIYRVECKLHSGENQYQWQALSPFPTGPSLVKEHPQITNACRFLKPFTLIHLDPLQFSLKENPVIIFADNHLFDVFTFPFLYGNPKTALTKTSSIVITEELSQKLFPNQHAMGKKVSMICEGSRRTFIIRGIMRNIPSNSHLHFDCIISIPDLLALNETMQTDNWAFSITYTYALIKNREAVPQINNAIRNTLSIKANMPSKKLYLKPLGDIHLKSQITGEFENNGNIQYVTVFVIIALFLLLIAGINFINLTTAFSVYRAKEMGVRKVIGATQPMLFKQIIGESLIISLIAMCNGMALAELLLDTFNRIVDRKMIIRYWDNPQLLGITLLSTLFIAFLSGIYPAYLLSSFKPSTVLKNIIQAKPLNAMVIKLLVVIQFVISIVLIVSSLIVFSQVRYMQNKDMGFDQEPVYLINFAVIEGTTPEKRKEFYQKIIRLPGVEFAGFSDVYICGRKSSASFGWEGAANGQKTLIYHCAFNPMLFKTYGIPILQQIPDEDIQNAFAAGSSQPICFINETAAQIFQWNNPIGKKIYINTFNVTVVGVFKDFHHNLVNEPILPLAIFIPPFEQSFLMDLLSIRVKETGKSQTLHKISTIFGNVFPRAVCNLEHYTTFKNSYPQEERLGKLLGYFSLLAIVIAALGLIGLASFSSRKRAKEIAIRKVYGAGITNILLLVAREFSVLILVANVIAWPMAYFAMSQWLGLFPYHITIDPWIFIITGGIALVTAVLAVCFHAARAALANPAHVLMYE